MFIVPIAIYVINPSGSPSYEPRGRIFGYSPYRVPSSSNTPTLEPGDIIFVSTYAYRRATPERGDFVVFFPPNSSENVYVKRVVGLPGEVVETDPHRVWINNELLQEDYLDYSNTDRNSYPKRPPTSIPDRHVFVLGDNRPNSLDSRMFGAVPIENIVGKVLLDE